MPQTEGKFSFRVLTGSSGINGAPSNVLQEFSAYETMFPANGSNHYYSQCYVPSVAGQRFFLRIRNDGWNGDPESNDAVSARVFIDGQLQYKGILRKPGDTHHIEGRVLSATAVAPFLFTQPTFAWDSQDLADETPSAGSQHNPNNPSPRELVPTALPIEKPGNNTTPLGNVTKGTITYHGTSIGEIRCEFWKVKETKIDYGQPSLVFGTNGFNAKAEDSVVKQEDGSSGLKTVKLKDGEKKTALLSHTVAFGQVTAPVVPVPQSRVHSMDLDSLPWIVYSIRYRSKDLLDAEGLTGNGAAGTSQAGRNKRARTQQAGSSSARNKKVKAEPRPDAQGSSDDDEVVEVPIVKKEIEVIVLDD